MVPIFVKMLLAFGSLRRRSAWDSTDCSADRSVDSVSNGERITESESVVVFASETGDSCVARLAFLFACESRLIEAVGSSAATAATFCWVVSADCVVAAGAFFSTTTNSPRCWRSADSVSVGVNSASFNTASSTTASSGNDSVSESVSRLPVNGWVAIDCSSAKAAFWFACETDSCSGC